MSKFDSLRNVIRDILREDTIVRKNILLYAVGENVEEISQKYLERVPKAYVRNREERDGSSHHVTLISPEDNRFLKKTLGLSNRQVGRRIKEIQDQIAGLPVTGMRDVGLGRASSGNNEVFFVVIDWPEGDKIRLECGLPKKDFHITLGFKISDIHGVSKDRSTLVD